MDRDTGLKASDLRGRTFSPEEGFPGIEASACSGKDLREIKAGISKNEFPLFSVVFSRRGIARSVPPMSSSRAIEAP